MNSPEENDSIDKFLREEEPYVADDGFTARVIAGLPPRRRAWLRPVILLGAIVVGAILAILWLPWETLPALDRSALLSLDTQVLLAWLPVLTVFGSLIWGVMTAVQWED